MKEYIPVIFDKSDNLQIYSAGYESNPAIASWGPGKRNYCILHYVTKGTGYFNGAVVKENQGFFIQSMEPHEYHSDKEDPWNYFWIIFSSDMAKKYVIPIIDMDSDGIFSYNFKSKLLRLFSSFSEQTATPSHIEALAFFYSLLSLHGANSKGLFGCQRQHVINAKTYIENNFNKKISVVDVAKAVHIDDRYMYNLFVKYEKISPKAYIEREKLVFAIDLLENTELTITEIASSVGFDDVFSFSNFFKRMSGKSPATYRKSLEKR